MKKVNHLAIAILFAFFGIYIMRMEIEVWTIIDKMALFVFGAISGLYFNAYWTKREKIDTTSRSRAAQA